MTAPLQLQIRNSFEAISIANETAAQWLEAQEASPSAAYLANLAIEELATNCVKYGYDDQREHQIDVSLAVEDGSLVLTVTDDGHPFDPLNAPEPDTTLPMAERRIGGLGIHLLKKLSDHMDYRRTDGRNHVTLRKKLR